MKNSYFFLCLKCYKLSFFRLFIRYKVFIFLPLFKFNFNETKKILMVVNHQKKELFFFIYSENMRLIYLYLISLGERENNVK